MMVSFKQRGVAFMD